MPPPHITSPADSHDTKLVNDQDIRMMIEANKLKEDTTKINRSYEIAPGQ